MGLFDFFKGKKEAPVQSEPLQEEVFETIEEVSENEYMAHLLKDKPPAEENPAEETIGEELPSEEITPQGDENPAEVPEAVSETVLTAADSPETEEKAEIEAVVEDAVDETVTDGEEIIAETEEPADRDTDTLEQVQPEEKRGFFAKLKDGLSKTRSGILGGVDAVLNSFTKIDEDLFEELEEALIMADIGVQTTMDITENLRRRVKKEGVTDPSAIKGLLIDEITSILTEGAEEDYQLKTPGVLLVIGVNGVGKTTTIGKLASNLKSEGKTVLLAAADTFRAAAIDQLEVWGSRSGIDIIKHAENSDPAAVVFDAVSAAKNRKTDILICDTAGRLHNKKNLMEELKKISRIIEREFEDAKRETYLVLDATTGQNALQQAKLFKEVADITGIVLTKLDGTAKGGIVVAIKSELQIPVRYVGVGEGMNDLQKFNAKSFAEALFGE